MMLCYQYPALNCYIVVFMFNIFMFAVFWIFFFFKQKTAYEMRISDWSSDVCSSDLSFLGDGKHHFYGGVNIEAVGGGAGLVEAEIARALQLGCTIRYETAATRLLQDRKGRVTGVEVRSPEGYEEITADAVILACGGFESNPEMRTRYLGPGWELARVRGTKHNMGAGIRMALDIGARPFGNWSGCHSVGWDISAPPYGDYAVLDNFQKHSYPWGVMVNLRGERFVDEGEDLRNHTYVKFGREID